MKAYFLAVLLSALPAVLGIALVIAGFNLILKTQHHYHPTVVHRK